MTFNDYQRLAQRTSSQELTILDSLVMASLGLAGESGEVSDLIKKWKFHKHPLGREKLIEEAGDILWYVAELCAALGVSMDEVAERNIEKLKKRYPEGFDPERSLNRSDEIA